MAMLCCDYNPKADLFHTGMKQNTLEFGPQVFSAEENISGFTGDSLRIVAYTPFAARVAHMTSFREGTKDFVGWSRDAVIYICTTIVRVRGEGMSRSFHHSRVFAVLKEHESENDTRVWSVASLQREHVDQVERRFREEADTLRTCMTPRISPLTAVPEEGSEES